MKTDKLLIQLTQADLVGTPVWYFPRDGSVADELVVRPVEAATFLNTDHELLVRTSCQCQDGQRHIGYVHWGRPATVNYLQPLAFVHGVAVTFWNGRGRPSQQQLDRFATLLPRNGLPITYESESVFGLETLTGRLDGIYFRSEGRIQVAAPM